jgi:hypothetical protein
MMFISRVGQLFQILPKMRCILSQFVRPLVYIGHCEPFKCQATQIQVVQLRARFAQACMPAREHGLLHVEHGADALRWWDTQEQANLDDIGWFQPALHAFGWPIQISQVQFGLVVFHRVSLSLLAV